ncbi:hypothetical protein IL54_2232 [Sphingobium sp. ba1]|nr:hypothetical protein IL54_2232 [Sphingobium sp. ba1]
MLDCGVALRHCHGQAAGSTVQAERA